jgi:hypothetical protein
MWRLPPAERLCQDCPYLNLPGEASWPVIAASDIIT